MRLPRKFTLWLRDTLTVRIAATRKPDVDKLYRKRWRVLQLGAWTLYLDHVVRDFELVPVLLPTRDLVLSGGFSEAGQDHTLKPRAVGSFGQRKLGERHSVLLPISFNASRDPTAWVLTLEGPDTSHAGDPLVVAEAGW